MMDVGKHTLVSGLTGILHSPSMAIVASHLVISPKLAAKEWGKGKYTIMASSKNLILMHSSDLIKGN